MSHPLADSLARPARHLCVDMQGMFAEETDWQTPWMHRVLPLVDRLVAHRPADTIFSRFMPPRHAEEREGTWRAYFERWHQFTLGEIDPDLVEIVPELRGHAPPARVFDKPATSPSANRSGGQVVLSDVDSIRRAWR